jgi:hypothetical protein
MRPHIVWLRLFVAVLFASATVLSLAVPTAVPAAGIPMTVHESHHGAPPCHGEEQAPMPKVDVAAQLLCLACVIHCMGATTLDAAAGLPHPSRWLRYVVADQTAHGVEPAGLERPPDLRA